jgi:thiamine-phosphate pyrophosphorylase
MFASGLYALADDGAPPGLPVLAQAEALLRGGVRVLQLRLKRTGGAAAVVLARRVVELGHQAGAVVLVNDRVDWALLASADGVHLGEDDLTPAEARRVLGPSAVVGVTVRSAAGAQVAREEGADYVGLGPVFAPRSKQVAAPVLGLEAFRREVRGSPLPVVGIGGIGLLSIREVAAAGAHGAAVVSDLLGAEDIPARARLLAEEFLRGRRERGIPGA